MNNRGIEIYSGEIYIANEEKLRNFIIDKIFTHDYFWSICSYVNQKFRNIGQPIDKTNLEDLFLLEDSRNYDIEYDNTEHYDD